MSRGILGPVQVVKPVANNMTGTVVINGLPLDWRLIRGGSIQVIWTGTPTGTFSVQGSLDYFLGPDGKPGNVGTWDDMGISVTAPSGSAGKALVDITITGIPWVKIVYTNTSGTGTLTAYQHGKGV